ncbi:hypothetical protein C4S77_05855 [Apibacter adventoris]|uniref:DUF1573 domain-containing protein n=2 Tax=Apibacter adventoris TaxID=1679466 RepID=A0A2S8AE02_9FLAO|nr:hypothetical protein C4S77_05855 [Apibacter adventoris]PQL95884.1 hypothetical protein C4S76_01605 [Apibacter adventoris]
MQEIPIKCNIEKIMKLNNKKIFILLTAILTLGSCTKQKESTSQNQLNEENQELRSKNDKTLKIIDESEIQFDEDSYDFKEIKKGETVSHVFHFTNKGKRPLVISEVRPSCGCTTPKYTKEPVAPGKKGSITVTFDSSNFEGTVLKSITVSGNFHTKVIKFQAKIN